MFIFSNVIESIEAILKLKLITTEEDIDMKKVVKKET